MPGVKVGGVSYQGQMVSKVNETCDSYVMFERGLAVAASFRNGRASESAHKQRHGSVYRSTADHVVAALEPHCERTRRWTTWDDR
jgi:hypothetical protein